MQRAEGKKPSWLMTTGARRRRKRTEISPLDKPECVSDGAYGVCEFAYRAGHENVAQRHRTVRRDLRGWEFRSWKGWRRHGRGEREVGKVWVVELGVVQTTDVERDVRVGDSVDLLHLGGEI